MKMELPVCVTEEDGGYVAVCPFFHVASQGDTEKEALANVIEALELFLEDEDIQKEFEDVLKQCTVEKHENFVVEVDVKSQTPFCIGA